VTHVVCPQQKLPGGGGGGPKHGGSEHVPEQYGFGPGQILPQLPQLYGSLSVLTHFPPQHVVPG
jgi:hypothetical protein